jgi:hypothetical protein
MGFAVGCILLCHCIVGTSWLAWWSQDEDEMHVVQGHSSQPIIRYLSFAPLRFSGCLFCSSSWLMQQGCTAKLLRLSGSQFSHLKK